MYIQLLNDKKNVKDTMNQDLQGIFTSTGFDIFSSTEQKSTHLFAVGAQNILRTAECLVLI